MIEALTTSCSPCAEGEQGDDQLRRVAEGDVEQAADPGPDRAASSSVARPISAAVGITPSAAAKKIRPVAGASEQLRRSTADRDQRGERDRASRSAWSKPGAARGRARTLCVPGFHGRRSLRGPARGY